MKSTDELLAELRKPHNDFPSYYEDLCARAAAEIERLARMNELGITDADIHETRITPEAVG